MHSKTRCDTFNDCFLYFILTLRARAITVEVCAKCWVSDLTSMQAEANSTLTSTPGRHSVKISLSYTKMNSINMIIKLLIDIGPE